MRLILDDLDVRAGDELLLGEGPLDRRRQPEHESSPGNGRQHPRRGVAHHRQHAHDFLVATAGQEADDERALVNAKPAPRLLARGRRPDLIEERVADELDRHPGPPIQRRLERKDGQDERHQSPDRPHPPSTPRPHLRRNEVHDGDADVPRRPGQE